MIAHFCLVLPYSSPSFSYYKPAPGMPVHGDRCTPTHKLILQKELLFSVCATPQTPTGLLPLPSPPLVLTRQVLGARAVLSSVLWHQPCPKSLLQGQGLPAVTGNLVPPHTLHKLPLSSTTSGSNCKPSRDAQGVRVD